MNESIHIDLDKSAKNQQEYKNQMETLQLEGKKHAKMMEEQKAE